MQHANGVPSGMPPGMRRANGISCRHAHANGMPSADFTDRTLKCDPIPPVVIQLCLWDFLLMPPRVTRIASGDAFCPLDFLIILGWVRSCDLGLPLHFAIGTPRSFWVGSCHFALGLQTDIGISDHAALRHAALAMTLHFANWNFGSFTAPSCSGQ